MWCIQLVWQLHREIEDFSVSLDVLNISAEVIYTSITKPQMRLILNSLCYKRWRTGKNMYLEDPKLKYCTSTTGQV
jgi:hypothetical protein